MAKTKREAQKEAGGLPYRPNVAAILRRDDGKIFVGERAGRKGAWQFPQGGVDEGETLVDALYREIEEEIGLDVSHYEIIERRSGYRYDFLPGHTKWNRFRGQEQTYFLCRFLGDDGDIELQTAHPEFGRFRWIRPGKFDLKWVPEFKRKVYRQVLGDFFES